MKLAVLFTGGKDSTLALTKAMEKEDVACLITMISKNKESYMFHTPNIDMTQLQSEVLGIPLIDMETEGKKEEELNDLAKAIQFAKEKCKIEGVVTGAVDSVYQASRIQKICYDLELFCFNPLWKMDQVKILEEIVEKKFNVIITGVSAEPFDERWLGRRIDKDAILELTKLQADHGISPSGEGGEIETTVIDAPMFKKRIRILETEVEYKNFSGVFHIKNADMVRK